MQSARLGEVEMPTLQRPAPETHLSRSNKTRIALLACGITYAVLYPVVNDGLGLLLYDGYNPIDQAISELGSIGAPTRTPLAVTGPFMSLLLVAFGFGIWRSAQGRRALRMTGGLLVALGALWPLWLRFPMTARQDMPADGSMAFNDVGHVVLAAVVSVLTLAMMGFSAAAFGKGFRIYSLLSIAAIVVFAVMGFTQTSRINAGEPTPWFGLLERLQIAPWLAWMAVLAIILMRTDPGRTAAARGPGVADRTP